MDAGSSPCPTPTTTYTITPLLLRNLIASVFISAHRSLFTLSQKSKLLQLIRYVLVTTFLFFLRLLPLLNHNDNFKVKKPCYGGYSYYSYPSSFYNNKDNNNKPPKNDDHDDDNYMPSASSSIRGGDTAIGRALWQLLSLVNDIPVSSRKYQLVRSLADTLIDDNHKESTEALRQVNRTVLSAAFSRILTRLEAAAGATIEQEQQVSCSGSDTVGGRPVEYRVLRAVRSIADVAWSWTSRGSVRMMGSGSKSSAEKLGAELLWLAQKLVACGYADEAVQKWAEASNLACLAVSVDPRLQSSLVKLSALLLKHAKDMGIDEAAVADDDDVISKQEQQKKRKMKMLVSWLPFLCRASNGSDVPVLSPGERSEVERVLEESIERLEEEEDQEKVLSLWLHHFTYCSSSDWPNLHASYARWCNSSRNQLLSSPRPS